jgi:hypothetical protein
LKFEAYFQTTVVKGVTTVSKSKGLDVVRIERITQVISVLRGHRVLLDGDLAELYAACFVPKFLHKKI